MFYATKEEAESALKKLQNKGLVNDTYFVRYNERRGYFITTWDIKEELKG